MVLLILMESCMHGEFFVLKSEWNKNTIFFVIELDGLEVQHN